MILLIMPATSFLQMAAEFMRQSGKKMTDTSGYFLINSLGYPTSVQSGVWKSSQNHLSTILRGQLYTS